MSYEKLCPVHRGFFAMSGRVNGPNMTAQNEWVPWGLQQNAGAEATAHFTRRLNASISAIGARKSAATGLSQAARPTRPPAIASDTKEHSLKPLVRVCSTVRRETIAGRSTVGSLLSRRSAAGLALENDLAGLEQRLEIGEDARPAAGDGFDQLRILPRDRMIDGQLDRAVDRLEFDDAERFAVRRQLRLPLMPPAQGEAARRIAFGDLALVGDESVRGKTSSMANRPSSRSRWSRRTSIA